MAQILSPYGQRLRSITNWDLTSTYTTGDQCVYSNQVYTANGDIPANTAFAVGTTGATWAISYTPGSNMGVKIVQMTYGGWNCALFRMSDGTVYGETGNDWSDPWPGIGTHQGSSGSYQGSSGLRSLTRITFNDYVTNVQETGKATWVGICGTTAYVLFDNGNLWTWGSNDHGQLGLGTNASNQNYTNELSPRLTKTSVAQNGVFINPSSTGRNLQNRTRVVVKLTDGTFWGCGHNEMGQLGLGNTNLYSYWVQLPWLNNADSVWNMGNYDGCIIACIKSGSYYQVWAAGYNGYGNLGDGTQTNITTAKNVTSNWTGNSSNTWAYPIVFVGGGYGYCGDNGTGYNDTYTLIHFSNGNIKTAGANSWSSLGNASASNPQITPVAVTLGGSTTPSVKQISTVGGGPGSVNVLLNNGDLWNWGYSSLGNLGRSADGNYAAPALVVSGVQDILFANMQSYAAEYYNTTHIRKTDGSFWAAGRSAYGSTTTGALGDGSIANSSTNGWVATRLPKSVNNYVLGQIHVGYGSTSSIRLVYDDNGNLWAWGYQGNGNHISGQDDYATVVPMRMNPNYI